MDGIVILAVNIQSARRGIPEFFWKGLRWNRPAAPDIGGGHIPISSVSALARLLERGAVGFQTLTPARPMRVEARCTVPSGIKYLSPAQKKLSRIDVGRLCGAHQTEAGILPCALRTARTVLEPAPV